MWLNKNVEVSTKSLFKKADEEANILDLNRKDGLNVNAPDYVGDQSSNFEIKALPSSERQVKPSSQQGNEQLHHNPFQYIFKFKTNKNYNINNSLINIE